MTKVIKNEKDNTKSNNIKCFRSTPFTREFLSCNSSEKSEGSLINDCIKNASWSTSPGARRLFAKYLVERYDLTTVDGIVVALKPDLLTDDGLGFLIEALNKEIVAATQDRTSDTPVPEPTDEEQKEWSEIWKKIEADPEQAVKSLLYSAACSNDFKIVCAAVLALKRLEEFPDRYFEVLVNFLNDWHVAKNQKP